MHCPVCKSECGEADKCRFCGFDQIRKEFINPEDYEHWNDTLVKTCEKVFNTTKAYALMLATEEELRHELESRSPFNYLMRIDDVFKVNEYWVAKGTLKKPVSVNQMIGLCSSLTDSSHYIGYRIPILKIEKYRKLVEAAFAGDQVGLLLDLPEGFKLLEGMYII